MSNILIVTDQPIYSHSGSIIAGPSISVTSVFAGDIAEKKLDAMCIKKQKFDTILHPMTVTADTPGSKEIFDFIYKIRDNSDGCRISIYGNKY